MNTNLNNLSKKSRRRARLIRLLLQFGHVITRKCLYTVIDESKCSISAYRLCAQNRRPHFPQRYGLIRANLSTLSNKLRRRDRLISVLLQLGQLIIEGRRSIDRFLHSSNCSPICHHAPREGVQATGSVHTPREDDGKRVKARVGPWSFSK